MKLFAIERETRRNAFCNGCNKRLFADDPQEVYAEESTAQPVYCSQCAAMLVYEDPTRSVKSFYTNTEGTQIDPEII